MVEHETAVVGRAMVWNGFGRIVEGPPGGAAEHEHAGQSDGAERVEPVGVLHNAGFERPGRNSGREAMRFDRVVDGRQQAFRVAGFAQQRHGPLGRLPGGQRTLRMVLGHEHAVVQPGGRKHHGEVGAFGQCQATCPPDHTPHVFQIVRRI